MKRSFEEVANNVKPVFLTKAQREQLALQRRQEEVAEQRRRAELLKGHSSDNQSLDSSHHRSSRDGDRDRDGDCDRYRDRDRDGERERDRERVTCLKFEQFV
ncbi:unnamed protein product [Amaranthus hypochondriacus]